MHFSKILGATALFHVTLFAAVLDQGFYGHSTLSIREPVIPKGGDRSGEGKGGKSGSGNSNSGKTDGANPDSGNPNTGKSNSGENDGKTKDKNAILSDDKYKEQGTAALQKVQDALKVNPRVDKSYRSMGDSYVVEYTEVQPDFEFDITAVLKRIDPSLDSTSGWTMVDVRSNGADPTDSTFIGYISNDQKNVIAQESYSDSDKNTGEAKLSNSEIMYQTLISKGADPSVLKNIIRNPVESPGSLQMMRRVVQGREGAKVKLDQPYSFTEKDENVKDVGNAWAALNGLGNGRPQSFVAADHPAALKDLQVVEIIVWPQLPNFPYLGSMTFRMDRRT